MSTTLSSQQVVGSEAWTDGARYSGQWKLRLQYVLKWIDEEALIGRALSLRRRDVPRDPDLTCWLSKKYSVGDYNLVRRLTFSDGVSWIARIRMPDLKAADWEKMLELCHLEQHEGRKPYFPLSKHEEYSMKSEVSTMRLISARTSIPVPTVHDYSTHDSIIGFPYMLMDYIDGSTAFELSTVHGDPMSIPSQYRAHYFAQMANIMVDLASLRFPAIGSITSREGTLDPDIFVSPCADRTIHSRDGSRIPSDVIIGPCADTYTGPYKTSADFYAKYPTALAETLNIHSSDGNDLVGLGIATELKKIHKLASSGSSTSDDQNLFVLVNLEIGTHNVLVDSSYTIVGVIDWDSTFSLPIEAAHMFPFCAGAEPGVPGAVEEVSFICPPINDERRAVCEAFATAVGDAAKARSSTAEHASGSESQHIGSSPSSKNMLTKDGFFTTEALAFRPLMFLKAKQDWVDKAWVPGLQYLQQAFSVKDHRY